MPNPAQQKTIICLANSRKPGGKCVAGKLVVQGGFGGWIRPISARPGHAVADAELICTDAHLMELLDIVSIPLLGPVPQGHQTENWQMVPGVRWTRQGRATWAQVEAATDNVGGVLLHHNANSFHGRNDKVPQAVADGLPNSLTLIRPQNLQLRVGSETKFLGGSDRKVRADFQFNGTSYRLVVTDPWIEGTYLAKADGVYPIAEARICVSLAEIVNGIATKVVAAVITPDRV